MMAATTNQYATSKDTTITQTSDTMKQLPALMDQVVKFWNQKSTETDNRFYYDFEAVKVGPNMFYDQSEQLKLVFSGLPNKMMTPWGHIMYGSTGAVPTNSKECIQHVIDSLKLDHVEKDAEGHTIAWSSEWPTGALAGNWMPGGSTFFAIRREWDNILSSLIKETTEPICGCCSSVYYEWRSDASDKKV